MLSKTAEYALRALLVLARRGTTGTVRAEEIADAVGAPRNYMAKTLHALTKEGLVASARGPLGGFTLTVAPDSISVARVADAFTEARGTGLCLLGDGPCDRAAPCAAHARWTSVRAAAREPLASTTLADLLDTPAPAPHAGTIGVVGRTTPDQLSRTAAAVA